MWQFQRDWIDLTSFKVIWNWIIWLVRIEIIVSGITLSDSLSVHKILIVDNN